MQSTRRTWQQVPKSLGHSQPPPPRCHRPGDTQWHRDLGREGFSTLGFSRVSFKLFCDCFYCDESVWPIMSHQDFSDSFWSSCSFSAFPSYCYWFKCHDILNMTYYNKTVYKTICCIINAAIFFEWMLNESNLLLNLFYYLLTREYWLPKSQGGSLGGEVTLHVPGWKLKKYLRDAWGKRLSGDVALSRSAVILSTVGKADRIILGRSVGGWGVPWEAHTKAGFEAPVVHLNMQYVSFQTLKSPWNPPTVSGGSDSEYSYSRTHWRNVFILISASVAEGEDFCFNRNKLIPQRRRNTLWPLLALSAHLRDVMREVKLPPGDEGMLPLPCIVNWLCANAIRPAADTLCAIRKRQRKQINQINLLNSHVFSLACHESYWVCSGYSKYLSKVKKITKRSSDFETHCSRSQNTSAWYRHLEVISALGVGHAHLSAALTFWDEAFGKVIHAPAWNFWITDSILD